jgi:hypothetical protein
MIDKNNPFAAPGGAERTHAVRALVAAAFITIALYFVPYAGYVTYPQRLLVTFIHEGAHALAGVLTGGWVSGIAVQPDGSGLTMTRGGFHLFTSSAGYLGATLYGALLIGLLRRGVPGKRLLFLTGVAVGLVTLGVLGGLFTMFPPNVFGLFWGVLLTAALVLGGLKLSPAAASWSAAFIGVQCVLNALFDLRTLFSISLVPGAHSDAANMARMTWIPAPFWAALWMVTSLAMLWFVLRPARRPAAVKF